MIPETMSSIMVKRVVVKRTRWVTGGIRRQIWMLPRPMMEVLGPPNDFC